MKIALITLFLSLTVQASTQSIYCYQSENQFLIEVELNKKLKKAQIDFKHPYQEQYVDRDVEINSNEQLAIIDLSMSNDKESLIIPLDINEEFAESALVKNGVTYPLLCKLL